MAVIDRIRKWSWIQWLVRQLDRIRPWGFRGMSLLWLLKFLAQHGTKASLNSRAAAISFKIFIAFFPGLILLLTFIPYIPIENFQENLLNSIAGFFPGDTFSLFESTITELVQHKYNTLLSIGVVLVLYYASNSVNAILMGFNESYQLEEKGNVWMIRFASLVLIFVLGLFMVVAVSMIIFSGTVFSYLESEDVLPRGGVIFILQVLKWLISSFLIYTVLSTLYTVGNARKRRRWHFFNPGATMATIFIIVSSILFAWFVNNFASYNKLYGSLGTLLILLIWLNFNSTILLLGFELNVGIGKAIKSRKQAETTPLPPPPPVNSYKEKRTD